MNNYADILALNKQVNKYAHFRDYWKEGVNRNKRLMCMLMIQEAGEATEAVIKKRIFNTLQYKSKIIEELNNNTGDVEAIGWIGSFKLNVKDTLEDEMADITMYLLDYCYGYGIPLLEREYRKESTGDYHGDLLRIVWYMMLAYEEKLDIHPGKDWGYTLAAILSFCNWYNIDLFTHINWKLRYNYERKY